MVAVAGIFAAAAPAIAGPVETNAFVSEGIGKQTTIVVPPEDRLAFIMKADGGVMALGWGPQLCAGPQQGFWHVEADQFCLVVPWLSQCFNVERDAQGYVFSARGFPSTHAAMSLASLERCF
jgi:hypothetical protein